MHYSDQLIPSLSRGVLAFSLRNRDTPSQQWDTKRHRLSSTALTKLHENATQTKDEKRRQQAETQLEHSGTDPTSSRQHFPSSLPSSPHATESDLHHLRNKVEALALSSLGALLLLSRRLGGRLGLDGGFRGGLLLGSLARRFGLQGRQPRVSTTGRRRGMLR